MDTAKQEYSRRETWAEAFCERLDLDFEFVESLISAMEAEAAYQKSLEWKGTEKDEK